MEKYSDLITVGFFSIVSIDDERDDIDKLGGGTRCCKVWTSSRSCLYQADLVRRHFCGLVCVGVHPFCDREGSIDLLVGSQEAGIGAERVVWAVQ